MSKLTYFPFPAPTKIKVASAGELREKVALGYWLDTSSPTGYGPYFQLACGFTAEMEDLKAYISPDEVNS